MNFDRRLFLKTGGLIMGGFILQGSKLVSNLTLSEQKNIREIRTNFGVYNEKGGTIGWYVQDDMVVVIDTQFPDSAKNFMNELDLKSIPKINYLFNTHHHNDHTQGNYYLNKFTKNIIAQENCPRLQIKHNKGKETEKQVVTANITFKSELKIKLSKEQITSNYFGKAHTGGDIVIHFENSNIAHVGDLVFNNVYPYLDNSGECSVSGWINVLDNVIKHFDNDTLFIFGHANEESAVTGYKKDLIKERNYLQALYTHVSNLAKQGKTIEEIVSTNTIPGFDGLKESWPGARKMNLKATAEQIKSINNT